MGEVVGAAVAEDLGGQLLSGAGIARQPPAPAQERPPQAPPLVAGEHEEHGEVPDLAADQGRDHATDLPFLDGAEVAVGVAGQARSGIARRRVSAGDEAGRPLRTRRSLLEATCTRQTSSISSGRTFRMCGSLTGASYLFREAPDEYRLFLDGEVRHVKNLTDFNYVTFFGRAPLRPFHELFF